MDYEKAYKEALERMKSWVRGEHPECFTEAQKAAEFIFPELKESEDERIRKEIIDFILDNETNEGDDINRWLVWLEKQGKYKSPEEDAKILELANIKRWLERQGERKSAWSEEDKHRLKDTIYFLDTAKKHYASTVELDACINWLKSLKPQKQWKPTKEQMDALLFVVQHYTPNVSDKLAWDSLKILELMYYEIKQ